MGWLQDEGRKSESCRIKVAGVMVAAVKVAAVVVAGAAVVAGVVVSAWWRCWVIDDIRVGAGETQVSYGLGEECVDEPARTGDQQSTPRPANRRWRSWID
jgi:hypothetical protein